MISIGLVDDGHANYGWCQRDLAPKSTESSSSLNLLARIASIEA